jgi:hypothetical protein
MPRANAHTYARAWTRTRADPPHVNAHTHPPDAISPTQPRARRFPHQPQPRERPWLAAQSRAAAIPRRPRLARPQLRARNSATPTPLTPPSARPQFCERPAREQPHSRDHAAPVVQIIFCGFPAGIKPSALKSSAEVSKESPDSPSWTCARQPALTPRPPRPQSPLQQ